MRIAGYATAEGTARYRQRFEGKNANGLPVASGHFREDAQGLALSSLGMGTYLGQPNEEDSRCMTQAAVRSVSSGSVNVLDTAINYRYQLSERAIGQALRELLAEGIQRDELLLCSKNGFLTPDAEALQRGEDFRSWFRAHFLDSGKIKPEDIAGGMHCMAPAYLEDQLECSLENLGVETLDLMYLHNAAESQSPEISPELFMGRLAKAFECYEKACQKNKIRYYGLATWSCFRVMPESPEYLSLERVVRLAESVGGPQHGFRFIQLPFNLAMTEALTLPAQPCQGEQVSLLEAAMSLGIGVMTSVPLLQGQLLNQSKLPQFERLHTPAQACLQFIRSQPGIIAPLVGQKAAQHVEDNLQVASVSPLSLPELEQILAPS